MTCKSVYFSFLAWFYSFLFFSSFLFCREEVKFAVKKLSFAVHLWATVEISPRELYFNTCASYEGYQPTTFTNHSIQADVVLTLIVEINQYQSGQQFQLVVCSLTLGLNHLPIRFLKGYLVMFSCKHLRLHICHFERPPVIHLGMGPIKMSCTRWQFWNKSCLQRRGWLRVHMRLPPELRMRMRIPKRDADAHTEMRCACAEQNWMRNYILDAPVHLIVVCTRAIHFAHTHPISHADFVFACVSHFGMRLCVSLLYAYAHLIMEFVCALHVGGILHFEGLYKLKKKMLQNSTVLNRLINCPFVSCCNGTFYRILQCKENDAIIANPSKIELWATFLRHTVRGQGR